MSKILTSLFCGGALALAFGCIGQALSFSNRIVVDAVAWDQPPYPTPGGVILKAADSATRLIAWDQPPYPPGPVDPRPKAVEATPFLIA